MAIDYDDQWNSEFLWRRGFNGPAYITEIRCEGSPSTDHQVSEIPEPNNWVYTCRHCQRQVIRVYVKESGWRWVLQYLIGEWP